MRQDTAIQFALSPPPKIRFEPIPFKLIKAKIAYSYRCAGEECVHPDMGEQWAYEKFDQWKRGDLLVICRRTRNYYQPGHKGPEFNEEWLVGRRFTTPSAARQLAAITEPMDGSRPSTIEVSCSTEIWRIPYRYRPSAEKLIGRAFESREALEAELGA